MFYISVIIEVYNVHLASMGCVIYTNSVCIRCMYICIVSMHYVLVSYVICYYTCNMICTF